MKILVTGSKGYFGKPLTEKLRKAHQIVDYDIVDGKDILNYDQLKEAMKSCDVVIHAAAIPKPDKTKRLGCCVCGRKSGRHKISLHKISKGVYMCSSCIVAERFDGEADA